MLFKYHWYTDEAHSFSSHGVYIFGCVGCENKQANMKSENELGDSYSDKLSEKN